MRQGNRLCNNRSIDRDAPSHHKLHTPMPATYSHERCDQRRKIWPIPYPSVIHSHPSLNIYLSKLSAVAATFHPSTRSPSPLEQHHPNPSSHARSSQIADTQASRQLPVQPHLGEAIPHDISRMTHGLYTDGAVFQPEAEFCALAEEPRDFVGFFADM